MKHILFILAFVGLSAAQAVGDYLPACAVPCFADAISSSTTCSLESPQCQCRRENILAITAASSTCLVKSCGQAVVNNDVSPGAQKYCAVANSATNGTATAIATTASSSSMVGASRTASTTSVSNISHSHAATSSMTTQPSSALPSTLTSTASSSATASPTILTTSGAAAGSRVGSLCLLAAAALGALAIL